MSEFWESAGNFYHLILLPTVKRMLNRRRLVYTVLTVGALLISVAALSFLLCHTFETLTSYDNLTADYQTYVEAYLKAGNKQSPMPEMREVLTLAKGEAVALSLLMGGIWLLLSIVAVGRVMASVMESEAYVYGLYMIYGSDRSRLSRGLLLEFLLTGIPALLLGIPLGSGLFLLLGGSNAFSMDQLWVTILCFLALLLLCASVLARKILGRSCVSLLNASDTSDRVIAPRRSHLGGLNGHRSLFASAWLVFWRMCRHYVPLALAAAIISASVFGTLSYCGDTATGKEWSYHLYFPNGISYETLAREYLEPLESDPAVDDCFYALTSTAEGLGTHLQLTESQNPTHDGIFLGAQYATDSIRIACGDGNTFFELGGNVTIPEEFSNKELSEAGYTLNAVPTGGAVYAYPKQTGPSLQVQVGDSVTISLPGQNGESLEEKVESNGETVTLRIVDVVEVGSIVVIGVGTEVVPRITEDYLYISPTDYEKFDGRIHAETFTAEEAYPDALFGDNTEGACILAVPNGYFGSGQVPDTVTVISPAEPIKQAFSHNQKKLSDEIYFINKSHKATGVYFGSEKDYWADPSAASLLEDAAYKALGASPGALISREYRVTSVIRIDGSEEPFLILPRSEDVGFAQLQNDLCAFRLGSVSADAPALTRVLDECYLLTSSRSLGNAGKDSELYIGTALMGDFAEVMEKANIPFLSPVSSFSHTRTLLKGRFSVGNTHYILAQPYPYPKHLDSDFYPRYVTGTGSFRNVGNTVENSIMRGDEASFYAVLHEDCIGSLKNESLRADGTYAINHWNISPVREALPSATLAAGQAVLAVPHPETCGIQPGDTVSVAIRQDTASLLNDPELMGLTGERLLSYLLERLDYSYITVTVSEIVTGETDTLILSEADLTLVLGQEGIYRDLYMEPSTSLSMKEYLDFHASVQKLVKQSQGTATLLYNEDFITQTARGLPGTALASATGGLSLCFIPLLLTASQILFFRKREEEISILHAIGKTERERRELFFCEMGLFCGTTVLLSALLCPVGYGILLLLANAVGLPLATASIRLPLYGGILAVVALSCAGAGLAAYRSCRIPQKNYRPRKEKNL